MSIMTCHRVEMTVFPPMAFSTEKKDGRKLQD